MLLFSIVICHTKNSKIIYIIIVFFSVLFTVKAITISIVLVMVLVLVVVIITIYICKKRRRQPLIQIPNVIYTGAHREGGEGVELVQIETGCVAILTNENNQFYEHDKK